MEILSTQKLTKRFQGVVALSNMDFDLKKGEIHAVVGENGAGKSTFVKLLAGIHAPSSGTYCIDGKETLFQNPKEALPYIGLVHQDRELIPNFNGYQNLFLGSEHTKSLILDNKAMHKECQELMEKYNLHIDLSKPASMLGAGEQEMLTILKILFRQPPILIFDEPTAPLSMQESETLFKLIHELKDKGFSMIYISHRLPEVLALSDRISILKNGKKVVTLENKDVTEKQLISYMISKDLDNQYPKIEKEIGDVIFEVKGYSYLPERLSNISFSVKRGEILGFAGLVGAGRTELNQAIFAGYGTNKGHIKVDGKPFNSTSARQSIRNGVVMVPEDRRGCGVIMSMSIKDNLIIPSMDKLTKAGFRKSKEIDEFSDSIIKKMSVVAASKENPINTLSGGNQQKISIGKWISSGAKVWIFDEPSQGIDVETKSEIYKMLGNFAKEGAGVIFISSDLRELTEICDSIYVMNERKIVGKFTAPFNSHDILEKMIGEAK